MDREVSLEEILAARDRRAARQEELRARNAMPVISYTLSVAGPVKRTALLHKGFELGLRRLREQLARHGLAPAEVLAMGAATGDEWLCAVSADPMRLKRLACAVEEADGLGRLMDVDVLDAAGRRIGRDAVGLPPRGCLLCDREARLCGRSRTHSAGELFACAERMAREALHADLADRLASLAQRALLYELAVTPKPGLVDRHNSGAHRDMDFYTFLDSASVLPAYFRDCALLGLERPEDQLPEALRHRGQCAETRMLEATRGINTHKGAIYSLGLLCGAAGLRCRMEDWPGIEDLCGTAARLARALLEAPHAAGPGAVGARGEAGRGFSSVRQAALPALRRALAAGWNLEEAGLMALMALLESVEDTNLLRRGSAAQREEVARRARALAASKSPPIREAQALDAKMIAENLSPGGCADLLCVAFFFHFLEEEAPDS